MIDKHSERHCEKIGLHLNIKKATIMDVKGYREPIYARVHDKEMEMVKSFEWIVSVMEPGGDGTKEIKRWLAMASKTLIDMEKPWKSTNNTIKPRVIRTGKCLTDAKCGQKQNPIELLLFVNYR